MAKGKGSIKGWITKNGVHIPIYGTYTVREGHEPTAKGSKFKRKKRPEEFDKDIRESGGKYWAAHSSAQGKKQGVKDLDKPFDTKEEARAFLAKENGEYEDAKFTSKAESGQEKDKYANRDWNKDVDDAKRYGYSEQTEEGKKPVTKAEEKKLSSFQEKVNDRFKTKREWDEIAKNAGYKDSDDPEFQKNADDIVAKNKQASSTPDMRNETKTLGDGGKVTSRIKAQEQAYVDNAFKPQVSEKERKMQELRDAERAYVNEAFNDNTKQASSTPDFSKMSYSEAGKYVSEHKKDFGLKPGDDAYQAAYEMKQGTWKQPKQEAKTVSTTESYPGTKSFGSSEPSATEYGKAMESISKRYDSENRTVPGKEMGKVFEGLKPGDQIQVHNKYSVSPDRYIVNEDGTIDYSTPSSSFLGKKGMSLAEAQKHATNSVDNRITVMRRKTEVASSTAKPIDKDAATSSNTAREQARTRASYKESNAKIANGEHTVDIKTDGSKKAITNAKKSIAKAAKKNDVQYGISEHKGVVTGSRMAENGATLDTQVRNMSVSGLKQAYNTATGTAKSKIRQELRRLGYTYVGGKWVKGNKS